MKLPLSVFTGKPEYFQALNFLDDVLLRIRPLIGTLRSDEQTMKLFNWHQRPEMSKQLGFALSDHQYANIVGRLESLKPFASQVPEIAELLGALSPNLAAVITAQLTPASAGPLGLRKRRQAYYDQQGRAVGLGYRKTAQATVTVVWRTGQEFGRCLINGEPAHKYFGEKAMEGIGSVLEQIDGGFRSLNWVATVEGGGKGGQAGAVALGLARALALDESHYQVLSAAGLLKRDPRIVERKKPGQEKARKKFAWVKR